MDSDRVCPWCGSSRLKLHKQMPSWRGPGILAYVFFPVAAMLWLWRQGRDSGVYNIGSGEARSFVDLMNALGAACGRAPTIEFVDIPPEIRPNYQYFTEAKLTRLRQAGYNAPFTPLEAAVTDLVTHHLAQNDPYL